MKSKKLKQMKGRESRNSKNEAKCKTRRKKAENDHFLLSTYNKFI
jgi:hypothetical protein